MPDLNEIIETDDLAATRVISKFVSFEKVDKEQRLVYGTISSENLDSQNQIVEAKAIEDALEDYMKYGNIREMHQPSAVGKAVKIWFENGLWKIIAKIVDDMAWKKVKEGVYNGFSIGGKTKPGGIKKVQQDGKFVERLTAIEMTEISLADRPANGDATFDMWKVAGIEPQSNQNEGGAAVMPPEQLENHTTEAGADIVAAADTSTAEAPAENQDQVVETPAQVTKTAIQAAVDAAQGKIEKAVTPAAPAPEPAPAETQEQSAPAETSEDVSKAAASRAVNSDDTEIAAIQAVLTELQGMRNTAESAGLPRKANLLGSACSAIVYLLAAINEPEREYDYYMSEMIGDLAKSQLAVEAAFTKVSTTAAAEPDEGLKEIEKTVVDGLAGIAEMVKGYGERLENLERQPAAGGPVLRAVEKTLGTALTGGTAAPDERQASIAVLQKMQSETSDPFQKARLGEAIAHEQIRLAQGFRN